MISYTSLQFYINAVLEVVAVLFLGILLSSGLLRKKEDATKLPLGDDDYDVVRYVYADKKAGSSLLPQATGLFVKPQRSNFRKRWSYRL